MHQLNFLSEIVVGFSRNNDAMLKSKEKSLSKSNKFVSIDFRSQGGINRSLGMLAALNRNRNVELPRPCDQEGEVSPILLMNSSKAFIQIYRPSPNTTQLIAFVLWQRCTNFVQNFGAQDTRFTVVCQSLKDFLTTATEVFQDDINLKLLQAGFQEWRSGEDPAIYEQIKVMNPPADIRFVLFKKRMDSQKKSLNQNTGDASLDLISYIEYQKFYR